MTDIDTLLARVWARTRPAASYVECRDCGTTLEPDATTCPACDSTDIARYAFDDVEDSS